jgi:hypothetical protein
MFVGWKPAAQQECLFDVGNGLLKWKKTLRNFWWMGVFVGLTLVGCVGALGQSHATLWLIKINSMLAWISCGWRG